VSQPPASTADGRGEHYRLRVNGIDHDVAGGWLGESLLYVLRERLGLYGSKGACEQGECGSCSVLVDGQLVCACLVLAATAVDVPIVSIEGIAGDDGGPSDVQQAFVDAGAVQCGFCTPGLVMAAHDLLGRIADPTPIVIAEELSGNICRCTGYGRIVAAVQQVAVSRRSPATQAVAGSALPFGHAGGTPFGHAGGAGASSLAPEARS
jgi:carbon-monoxide dehydrogenase small subunit